MTLQSIKPSTAASSGLVLHPSSKEELSSALRAAHTAGQCVARADLQALPRLLTHVPEDLTVTVSAGVTVAELQSVLRQHGQWLPVDPPQAERLTVGALLATNASGPRRFGYGSIRDHLIGLEVALGDGRLIHSGGKVVKNVAGFDLLKLFVGDHGSLGLVVEATFKLRPVPEVEHFVRAGCASLPAAGALIDSVLTSPMTPVVLDLHDASIPSAESASDLRGPADVGLTLGFAGTHEEVEWQLAQAADLGFLESGSLEHDARFHAAGLARPRRASVLPSRLVEFIGTIAPESFIARAGNGVVYYRGGPPASQADLPLKLLRRIKDAFDPKHVFPDAPA